MDRLYPSMGVYEESIYVACKPASDQLWHLNRSHIFGSTYVFYTDRFLFKTGGMSFFYLEFLENKYTFCNQSMNNEIPFHEWWTSDVPGFG